MMRDWLGWILTMHLSQHCEGVCEISRLVIFMSHHCITFCTNYVHAGYAIDDISIGTCEAISDLNRLLQKFLISCQSNSIKGQVLHCEHVHSCFSCCHITTNSIAPSLLYESHTTPNSLICSNEGLHVLLKMSAF